MLNEFSKMLERKGGCAASPSINDCVRVDWFGAIVYYRLTQADYKAWELFSEIERHRFIRNAIEEIITHVVRRGKAAISF
jgi:hypothetical protein